MHSIPRTRKQQLEREKRMLLFSSKQFDAELYWQIDTALLYASLHDLATVGQTRCEHDLLHCPVCDTEHDEPAPQCYNIYWGVQ